MVGRRLFPFGMASWQVRTVIFRECISISNKISSLSPWLQKLFSIGSLFWVVSYHTTSSLQLAWETVHFRERSCDSNCHINSFLAVDLSDWCGTSKEYHFLLKHFYFGVKPKKKVPYQGRGTTVANHPLYNPDKKETWVSPKRWVP